MYRRLFSFVVLSATLAACGLQVPVGSSIQGSGTIATRDYTVGGFTKIAVSDGFMVTVGGGDLFRVSVTADDNVLDVLKVRQEGETLWIGMDTAKANSIRTTKLEAVISMPELRAVTLDSGSQLRLAQPSPKATSLTLTAKAGSQADLGGMTVREAKVTLREGSRATIRVTGSLDYDLSDGSQLRYTGGPSVGVGKADGGSTVSGD